MIPDIYTNEIYCLNCGGENLSAEGSYSDYDKFICNDCGDTICGVKTNE